MTANPSEDTRIALVTGANRGIGLEVCRQLAGQGMTVLLGSRDATKGQAAAESLRRRGAVVQPVQLDVTDRESIERTRAAVERDYGRLDVLVNNAAALYDTWQRAAEADLAQVREALEINTLGAWQMVQSFLPLLKRSNHGRIVNVSSQAGSLDSLGAGTPAYSLSKAALNAFTIMLAADLRRSRILVNAVCPGWVATDMGGPGGRPVEAGAASVVWAVNLPDDGPTGGFFRDGRSIPW
ncbi:MAG: SDR family oxidoreductase [Chloroflexi bacterium]|nr:SDR family oxidoreductase [Chloroflexota bacterium]